MAAGGERRAARFITQGLSDFVLARSEALTISRHANIQG
jgi:hypothetical protein